MVIDKSRYTDDKWKCKNHEFLSPIDLKPLNIEYSLWETQAKLKYYSKDMCCYIVDKGFSTDGASIPKIFWSIIGSPFGKYCNAALIHDKLYNTGETTRSRADYIFYEAMTFLGVQFWKRKTMWVAVRIWAGYIWNKRHKKREAMIATLKSEKEDVK